MKKLGYIKVRNGVFVSGLQGAPRWFIGGDTPEDGQPVTDDAIFIESGYFPVIENPPDFDEVTQRRRPNPLDQWALLEDRIEVTFTIEDKTPEEITDHWVHAVSMKREEKLAEPIPVTDTGGTVHEVSVSNRQLATIKTTRERAQNEGTTKPFPTRGGIREFNGADLLAIEEAIDDHVTAVLRKESELEGKIKDGTITQEDIDGW